MQTEFKFLYNEKSLFLFVKAYSKNKDYVLEINSIDILEQNLRNYINEDLTERSIDVGNMFSTESMI